MKRLPVIALSAAIALAGFAAPALATDTSRVPYCSTGNNAESLATQQWALSTELQLGTKPGSSIEVWNGCFKVMTTDTSGVTTISFYDPDSLRLVARMG
jgi:hypothetical protein